MDDQHSRLLAHRALTEPNMVQKLFAAIVAVVLVVIGEPHAEAG